MNDIERTLPALTGDYPLAAEQIEAYGRDGHILLRGVADGEEAAAYEPVLSELVLGANLRPCGYERALADGERGLRPGILRVFLRAVLVRRD